MTEAPLAVASVVILPEDSAEPAATTSPTLKRRQSSLSDEGFKRPRLSNGESEARQGTAASPTTSTTTPLDRASERRKSGQVEERKRGQRLFGALLGTLSQSSSSTAQKRRTDIEKKQQAKLRQQAEEQDEKKKQKREALLEIRRKEQVKYDKQSMQIRHSNMLAQANFLHTKTEPRLYYKPWELLPGDEERIKNQIDEAEQIITKENMQWDEDHPVTDPEPPPDTDKEHSEPKEPPNDQGETVGSATNEEQSPAPVEIEDTNMADAVVPNDEPKHTDPSEDSKDQGDDGGEELVGEEDTVIY